MINSFALELSRPTAYLFPFVVSGPELSEGRIEPWSYNRMKRLILVIFSLIILSFSLAHADTEAVPATNAKQLAIIFDLGGVVLETKSAMQFIGIPKLLAYAMTQNPVTMPQKLKQVIMDFLHELHERHPHEVNAQDDQGNLLPQCMCHWMKGTHTPEQLRETVNTKLAERETSIENSIIQAVAHMMFTPELFAQTQHVIPETAQLIQELKDQGYKLYVLSNFCSSSFNLIKERYPEFFALFDGIVISADVGFIKPDPNIYAHILSAHNIDPKNACFIDDLSVNLEAAQEFGLHTIQCPSKYSYFYGKSPDIDAVRQELQTWQNSFKTSPIPVF